MDLEDPFITNNQEAKLMILRYKFTKLDQHCNCK